MFLKRDRTSTKQRRELRNAPTLAEQVLWQSLRRAQLDGRKFRRQEGIEKFIVDFYCPEERLAIELDGPIHDDPTVASYDASRQAFLESLGIKFLRFKNDEVLQEGDKVIATIRATWKGRERETAQSKSIKGR